MQVSARTVDDRRAERPEAAGMSAKADENADRLRSSGRGLRGGDHHAGHRRVGH
jgi:hypothetical protein